MPKYVSSLIVTAIIGLSVVVYWNSIHNDFVNMDDLDLIVRNPLIKALTVQNLKEIFTPGVAATYQPIRTLSYALDYHVWKLNPTGYHLTNIFCQACNTFLAYLIVYALCRHFLIACCAALLFAVHPVHVEAVTWLSGRRDVLSTTFALLSFYCFLRSYSPHEEHLPTPLKGGIGESPTLQPLSPLEARSSSPLEGGRGVSRNPGGIGVSPTPYSLLPTPFFYVLSLLFFTLGLLTKPSVVILPLLLVLYGVCFSPTTRQTWRRGVWYVPFLLIAFGFTRMVVSLSRASGIVKTAYHGGDAYTTLLTMLRVLAEYIFMLFAPQNLSLTYGVRTVWSLWNRDMLVALVVLLMLGVCAALAWKRSKLAFFGIGWFLIGLLPVSNIIPIAVVKADRYLYLPSVGFFLAAAWLIVRGWTFLKERKAAFAPSQERKAVFASSSFLIAGYWLLIGLIVVSYAWQTIQRNRDWQDSETLWAATLDTTPDSSIALNNLGLIYAGRGLYDKAIALYEQLLELHPDQEKIERVYANMASAYIGERQYDQAIDAYEKALIANPEYENAYFGLAQISMERGQYDKAAEIYRRALELNPSSAAVYNQLGNLSVAQGKYDDALATYQKAIELNPLYIEAYNGLGSSYAGKGDLDNALTTYQRALRIDPESAVLRNSLGSLYMEQDETEKAIAEFQASVRSDPHNVEVRNNLGILLLRAQRYEDALRELMAAATMQPDDPKILSNLGSAYAHVGLYNEAIQILREALQINPALVRTAILLGDICYGTKDFVCAVDAYQQALTLQPENQEVREKLQTVKAQQPTDQ